ncbi:unnamed protein product, partial [Prorocentrum cordatum]
MPIHAADLSEAVATYLAGFGGRGISLPTGSCFPVKVFTVVKEVEADPDGLPGGLGERGSAAVVADSVVVEARAESRSLAAQGRIVSKGEGPTEIERATAAEGKEECQGQVEQVGLLKQIRWGVVAIDLGVRHFGEQWKKPALPIVNFGDPAALGRRCTGQVGARSMAKLPRRELEVRGEGGESLANIVCPRLQDSGRQCAAVAAQFHERSLEEPLTAGVRWGVSGQGRLIPLRAVLPAIGSDFVAAERWGPLLSGKWGRRGRDNLRGRKGVAMVAGRLWRTPSAWNHRVFVYTDALIAVGALSKCRARARESLGLCRPGHVFIGSGKVCQFQDIHCLRHPASHDLEKGLAMKAVAVHLSFDGLLGERDAAQLREECCAEGTDKDDVHRTIPMRNKSYELTSHLAEGCANIPEAALTVDPVPAFLPAPEDGLAIEVIVPCGLQNGILENGWPLGLPAVQIAMGGDENADGRSPAASVQKSTCADLVAGPMGADCAPDRRGRGLVFNSQAIVDNGWPPRAGLLGLEDRDTCGLCWGTEDDVGISQGIYGDSEDIYGVADHKGSGSPKGSQGRLRHRGQIYMAMLVGARVRREKRAELVADATATGCVLNGGETRGRLTDWLVARGVEPEDVAKKVKFELPQPKVNAEKLEMLGDGKMAINAQTARVQKVEEKSASSSGPPGPVERVRIDQTELRNIEVPARRIHAACGRCLLVQAAREARHALPTACDEAAARGGLAALPGSGLEPHTDGYVYGDDMPDYLFLLCEQPSPQGGANVLLDGHRILSALEAGDAAAQELARFLAEIDVDLSEPGESGIMT